MTAICGGGTSAPLVGASAVVLVGSGTIATLLEKSGNPWLQFAAALLTLPELVLSTFCSSDPPTMPTFTSAESAALLNVTFGVDLTSGLAKFADLVQNLAWQEYCHCTSGALVVPPPVAPPAGTPIYQPPSAPVSTPCFSAAPTFAIYGGPDPAVYATFFPTVEQIPTYYVASTRTTGHTGTGQPFTLGYRWTNGATLVDVPGPVTYNDPQALISQSGPLSLPNVRALYFALTASPFLGTGDTDVFASVDVYCNGAMPGVQLPCCPPDVATQSSLDLILKMVTLIQRQIAPFAYLTGTVHTGLTGNGQIAVSGLLGVAVSITLLPARAGRTLGNPDELYDVGWINVGTADGWGPRQFISSTPFILRPVAGDVTLIGYSIPADVTATITELVREP